MSHFRVKISKIICQTFPYAKTATLSLGGEPLLAENLDYTIEQAKFYGIRYNITTNGSLLNKPGLIEKILPVLNKMIISIDGASSQTFAKVVPSAIAVSARASSRPTAQLANAKSDAAGSRDLQAAWSILSPTFRARSASATTIS